MTPEQDKRFKTYARRVQAMTWVVAGWVCVWAFARPYVAGDSVWGFAPLLGPLLFEVPFVWVLGRRALRAWEAAASADE
jgi:hypothetical protein